VRVMQEWRNRLRWVMLVPDERLGMVVHSQVRPRHNGDRVMRHSAIAGLRRFGWAAVSAGLLSSVVSCVTDDSSGSEPRGEAILRVLVTARSSGQPVPGATIHLFADYERECDQEGPSAAELLTDANGALRVQSEGPRLSGGTCLSLTVLPPAESALEPSERVPFVLDFRTAPPLDSIQVDVALEPEA
jgi:hypothetical protein